MFMFNAVQRFSDGVVYLLSGDDRNITRVFIGEERIL